MTNHLKIPYILSRNIPELSEILLLFFFPEISLPCQKNFVEGLRKV